MHALQSEFHDISVSSPQRQCVESRCVPAHQSVPHGVQFSRAQRFVGKRSVDLRSLFSRASHDAQAMCRPAAVESKDTRVETTAANSESRCPHSDYSCAAEAVSSKSRHCRQRCVNARSLKVLAEEANEDDSKTEVGNRRKGHRQSEPHGAQISLSAAARTQFLLNS